jgi:hypothetical protein
MSSSRPAGASAVLLPAARPLITLAYAQALDLLLKPQWPVHIVDMVLHELTRNATPTSETIRAWVQAHDVRVVATRSFTHFQAAEEAQSGKLRKANLGELANQKVMQDMALSTPEQVGVFLFEDHKIARVSFLLPGNCRKVSTRAWLQFLQARGWIESAAEVERAAISNGRNFSRLRFPA